MSDEKLIFDYSKLRGRIYEKYKNADEFARAIGTANSYVSDFLRGQRGWSDDMKIKACRALDIPLAEIGLYFFVIQVQ